MITLLFPFRSAAGCHEPPGYFYLAERRSSNYTSILASQEQAEFKDELWEPISLLYMALTPKFGVSVTESMIALVSRNR